MCWGEVWGGPESGWNRQARWADFGGVGGGAGCGVARGLGGAGRPARPIKRKAAFAARWGARYPAACGAPESPLANFGSVGGGAGCVVARSVRGAVNVKVMETHVVRWPVKGGPARIGLIKMTMKLNRAGGPGVQRTPGRRPPHRNGGTFGSFSHERTTIIRYVVKKMAAKLSRQVSCKTNFARANKEKDSVSGGAGCGVSRGVGTAGRPARPILAACAAAEGAGLPGK